MFVVFIVARLVTVLFSFCGVVLLYGMLSGGARFSSAAEFAMALAAACWPFAVAVLIELVLTIACQLEQMRMSKSSGLTDKHDSQNAPLKPVIRKQPEPASAAGQFFRANPQVEPIAPVAKTSDDAPKEEMPPPPQDKKPEPVKKESELSFFRID